MTYYVSSGTLNPTHSLVHYAKAVCLFPIVQPGSTRVATPYTTNVSTYAHSCMWSPTYGRPRQTQRPTYTKTWWWLVHHRRYHRRPYHAMLNRFVSIKSCKLWAIKSVCINPTQLESTGTLWLFRLASSPSQVGREIQRNVLVHPKLIWRCFKCINSFSFKNRVRQGIPYSNNTCWKKSVRRSWWNVLLIGYCLCLQTELPTSLCIRRQI